MIVTCPSCNAKYRVRDDAVPHGGAQLKCPECDTLFLAHRPAHSDQELTDAIDRLTKQNHETEARVKDLEKRVKDVTADAERQKSEFRRLNEDAGRALVSRDREIADLQAQLARERADRGQADQRAEQLRTYEARVQQLARELQATQDELQRVRSNSVSVVEVNELKEALVTAQKATGRVTSELNNAQGTIAHLQEELQRVRQMASGGSAAPSPWYDDEVKRLRAQLAEAMQKDREAGSVADPQLRSLIGAMSPMLWGLDQAIRYLEPFAPNEPSLANHVRQLQLLAGVLRRLAETTGEPASQS